MIDYQKGNILASDAEALVNTVNCVGVMGKGIALQFRQAFPNNFREYEQACRAGEVQPGRMFTFFTGMFVNPKYIINFPTKRHWKGKSQIEDIKAGLVALIAEVKRLEIRSIAIPPLGCGNGGLDWQEVGPLIKAAFAAVPDVQVLLFAPQCAPTSESMPIATTTPKMTRARALLVRLLELYALPGYKLTLLEVQKLAYFLQVAGEPLKLDYMKYKYGPYAENLNHVLQRMEGHYIRGYGDRSKQTEIYLLPDAIKAAHSFLESSQEASAQLEKVSRLISGFETPYGMELLATIHWVAQEEPKVARDVLITVEKVHQWSKRKQYVFKPAHIHKAWQRLYDEHWFEDREPHNHAVQN